MKEGWRDVGLGDVCSIQKTKYNGDNLPFVGLEDVESGTGRFLGQMSPRSVESSTFYFSAKHLLYGRLRPYLNKVLRPDFEGHCSSEIFPLLPCEQLDRSFLYYWVTNKPIVDEINRTSTGARMPRANVSKIFEFQFPLPPLLEQKRIVAILDEAFEGIDLAISNTGKNLANVRELFTNRLSVIFTSPSDTMKEEWKTTSLEAICIVIAGQSPEGKNYNDHGEGLPFYQGKKDFGGKYVGPPRVWTTQVTKEARAGDILMSVRAPVGPINFAVEAACIGRGLAAIRAKTIVDRNFLFYGLLQKQPEISGNEGAVFASINKKQIENLDFPLPPISEQKRIVSEIDQLSAESQRLEDAYRRKIALFVDLKQSILHKAFSGELTTQPDRVLKETVA